MSLSLAWDDAGSHGSMNVSYDAKVAIAMAIQAEALRLYGEWIQVGCFQPSEKSGNE